MSLEMIFEDGQSVNNIAFDIPRKAFYNVHLEIVKFQKKWNASRAVNSKNLVS